MIHRGSNWVSSQSMSALGRCVVGPLPTSSAVISSLACNDRRLANPGGVGIWK